ncbi:MAG: DNA methyltransferase [Alphaproteobacteria bacterium]|nr:DNA methyltransferase [Alphaproteobacteria bacterium]
MVKLNFDKPNQLFYGDNIAVLRAMPPEVVDLCYIDPPFNSKRNYFQIYNGINDEVDRAQSQAFMDTWQWGADAIDGLKFIESPVNMTGNDPRYVTFSEQTVNLIKGLHLVLGNSGLMAYLVSMTLRISEIHRVLKDTGSFYLHCDPTASHYLKLICDSIFCAKNRSGRFLNEIIWSYRTGGVSKTKHLARKHDVIFFYSKGKDFKINPMIERQYLGKKFMDSKLDSDGRHYIDTYLRDCLEGTYGLKIVQDSQGDYNLEDELRDFLHAEIVTVDSSGKVSERFNTRPVLNLSKERLGYATQKPKGLLELLLRIASNPGDLVLDAYCGCGTTVAVAQKLNRRWIGIDITYQSISLILKSLKDSNREHWPEVEKTIYLSGAPEDIESARALANNRDDRLRKEFEKWAVLTYSNNKAQINDKKGKDQGIDGISYFMKDRDSATHRDVIGKVIYQVKSGKVGSKDIRDLIGVCASEKGDMGILITLEPPTRDMEMAVHRAGKIDIPIMGRSYPAIKIVTIQELMAGSRDDDLPLVYDVVKSAQKAPESEQPLL